MGDPSWDYGRLDVRAALERLPFSNNRFDRIVCTETLEHVTEPDRVLRELARVIRPGGILLLSVPVLSPVHQAPHDYFRYTPFGLRHLLKKTGFTAVSIDTYGVTSRSCTRYSSRWAPTSPWRFPEAAHLGVLAREGHDPLRGRRPHGMLMAPASPRPQRRTGTAPARDRSPW